MWRLAQHFLITVGALAVLLPNPSPAAGLPDQPQSDHGKTAKHRPVPEAPPAAPTLRVAARGDSPCTALPLDTTQCALADNTAAPGTNQNAGCADYRGSDVWFTMPVPPSGNVRLTTGAGSLTDTGLAVWTGTACTQLQLVGCDDDGGPGYYSQLQLYGLPAGAPLYIQVWGYSGATGSFQLCARELNKVSVDSSELPIVLINTLGQPIVPDMKTPARLEVKYRGAGQTTYLTDSSNVYSGQIGIEVRGASSAGYPQRPFGFETRDSAGANLDVSLLGMPAENDWVLLSNFNDRSLIRNTLAHQLFGEMGNYAVRTRLCEVLVDSVYEGIYVLAEKIKRDRHRVAIAKLAPNDTTGDALTGGYILQQNYWDASNSFQSNYSPIDHPGFDVHFVYEYPKPDEIAPVQKAYIAAFVDSLETALYSPNFADPATGYRRYLDTKSFIDYFLVNELARSNDGFKKSVFFHKDKHSNGGKLQAGPVWDFDWAWKNMYGCSIFERMDGSGWAHHINDCPTDNYSCGYYVRLLQDTTFTRELRCTYESYRRTILDTGHLFHYIDSIGGAVQHAQARHFQRWPILGMSGPAPEVGAIATTYPAELDTLKSWIRRRLRWLDANIPGLCAPVVTAVHQPAAAVDIRYFPNPTTGAVHFTGLPLSEEPLLLSVWTSSGQRVVQLELPSGQPQCELNLPPTKGLYYFTIRNSRGLVRYGKVVVL